jgi:glycerol-3-phosphate acyltransferase PlsY
MYVVKLIICAIAGYLAGSINFAILISRWAKGIDIRTVGNRNPGTANVGREVGKGWASLVFAGDLAKVLVPLILFRMLWFPGENASDYLALFLTGIMAITGHCWPLYHHFRGGGGLATSIGVYSFFIPVEFIASLLISFFTVVLFFRREKYAYGQVIPIFFVILAPVFTILSNLFLEIPLGENLQIGGHPWYVVAGVITLSVYIALINIRILRQRIKKDV